MNEKWLAAIDEKIDSIRDALTETTIRLIRVKSVKGEPQPGAPFGEGPKKMLDTVLEMAENEGFITRDYGVGVISAALHKGQPDLGIWLHGDVVPEGDGWIYPPYEGTVIDGCIVGRGSADNKGQLAAIFHLLKIFRELEIPLRFNPALYVGSNEETGMADLQGDPGNPYAPGFLHKCTPPRLSLVPDSGFPLGYGGKGSVQIQLKSRTPLTSMTFSAGLPASPGLASASLSRSDIPAALPPCTLLRVRKRK